MMDIQYEISGWSNQKKRRIHQLHETIKAQIADLIGLETRRDELVVSFPRVLTPSERSFVDTAVSSFVDEETPAERGRRHWRENSPANANSVPDLREFMIAMADALGFEYPE